MSLYKSLMDREKFLSISRKELERAVFLAGSSIRQQKIVLFCYSSIPATTTSMLERVLNKTKRWARETVEYVCGRGINLGQW